MGLKKDVPRHIRFSCFRCENKFVFAYCSGQWYNHRRNFEPVNDRLKGYARSRTHGKGRKRKREEHIDAAGEYEDIGISGRFSAFSEKSWKYGLTSLRNRLYQRTRQSGSRQKSIGGMWQNRLAVWESWRKILCGRRQRRGRKCQTSPSVRF